MPMSSPSFQEHILRSHARRFLHVGCGPVRPERLPDIFRGEDWSEVRFDIDARVAPDIIGSITDMHAVPSGSMDALWSSHNLEHLDSFEVPRALAEFRRVLRPEGFALITVPDLKAVARHIANDNLQQPLYHSPAGPITPLDVVFGHQASIQAGNGFMARRTGFTATTLGEALVAAGFTEVRVHEGRHWDLWAVGLPEDAGTEVFDALGGIFK